MFRKRIYFRMEKSSSIVHFRFAYYRYSMCQLEVYAIAVGIMYVNYMLMLKPASALNRSKKSMFF